MMSLILQTSVAAVAPLGFALLITPIMLKLAHRYKWYDAVDARKIHTKDTPHVGGVGIFASMILGIATFYVLNRIVFNLELVAFGKVALLLVALLAIHVTGVVDDFKNIRARYKFLAQLILATVLVAAGFVVKGITLPWSGTVLHLGPAAYLLSAFWIISMSNAVNFVDGMDGLSGGAVAIAALTYGIVFALLGAYTSALIAFTIFGAVVGFLFFNWPPAKIFMGDSGAIFLGFALGALPFLEHSGNPTLLVFSLVLSVSIFPILDTLMAIIRRLRRRIAINVADKEHTHHKLLDFGIGERGILLMVYSLMVLPNAATILWAATKNDRYFWLVGTTWILVILFFAILDVWYHKVELAARRSSPTQPKPADAGK
jgi:UDP-GlcNAc:undecaprenyl-phosphate/decaprenyl-phosphate GlcNAc-1-phosphate transferase